MRRPRSNADTAGIDAIVWLDPPLVLARAVAGRSYDVRIDGRSMTLTLPKRGLPNLPLPSSEPPSDVPEFPPPPLATGKLATVHMGLSSSLQLPEQIQAASAFRLRWRDPELEKTLDDVGVAGTFSQSVGAWLRIVRDWLAVWSGNVRERVDLEATPHVRLTVFNDSKFPATGGGPTPVIVLGQVSSATIELTAAFAAASHDFGLPLERQLLAEAVVQAVREQGRHAVISACSAAEVALSRAAYAQLKGAGRNQNEAMRILKGVQGVVELYRINATRRNGLAVSIGQVKSQLAGPRNDAVHAGQVPNEDAARAAIKTARALIDVLPLPTPRSLIRQLGPVS